MHSDDNSDGPSLVSNRTMEIVVALLFLGISAIVIYDARRLGTGWTEGEGPASGYFPFYIALFMALAALIVLAQAITGRIKDGEGSFVSVPQFGRVLAVILPTLLFIAVMGGIKLGPISLPGLGLYASSALFIFGFMIVFGRENAIKAALVSIGVPLALFFMFEKWFLVPLPKGPIEAMLGY